MSVRRSAVGAETPSTVDDVELGPVTDNKEATVSVIDVDDSTRRIANFRSSDEYDMYRLGKKQQFQRNFQFVSIVAFSVTAIAGWVYVPSTMTYGLYGGQTGGVFFLYVVEFFGLLLVVLCLAEMASIAPTAGGQYHWSSEFAPERFQKIISYFSGWLATLAWLSGVTGGVYPAAFTLQGLIVLGNPSFKAQPYQVYLFAVMIITVALFVNTLLAKYLPKLEGFVFVLFFLAFLVFLVVLWVLPSHLTAHEVFTTITKGNGWHNLGLTILTGQSNLLFLIIGSDATAHMSEETKSASTVIPKAMVTSYIINGLTTMAMIITYFFCLVGYSAAENSETGLIGLPYLQVFANISGSRGGGQALVSVMVVLQIFGTVNWTATCARQIFAFARDRGLPFGAWISKVNAQGTYPVNAVLIVWTYVVLLCLISLGSPTALNAITSLTALALFSTYSISLACLLWRRLYGNNFVRGPWNLGRFGVPINILALCYCVFLISFLPWPVEVPVTAENFNWSSVIFLAVLLLSGVYYVAVARHVYKGPVKDTKPHQS